MSRLQPAHKRVGALPQGHPGLCGTLVGPGKDTHGTPVLLRRKAAGGPTEAPRDDHKTTHDNTTKTGLRHTCFQETSAVRETGDLRRLVKLRQQVEMETSRIIKKIAQEKAEPINQEKITQEKINQETEHVKISQNQCTDKVVDVTVVIQRQLLQNPTMHRRKPDK